MGRGARGTCERIGRPGVAWAAVGVAWVAGGVPWSPLRSGGEKQRDPRRDSGGFDSEHAHDSRTELLKKEGPRLLENVRNYRPNQVFSKIIKKRVVDNCGQQATGEDCKGEILQRFN